MAKKPIDFRLTYLGTFGKGSRLFAYIKAAIFMTLAFAYLFWSFDMVPDVAGPIVGWVDDAFVFLFAAWAIRGALKTIIEKKGAFLGGGK